MRLRSYLLPPVVFLLAGPAIGYLMALVHSGSGTGHGLLFVVLLAYVFGAIPALVCGCLYVVLWPLLKRLPVLNTHELGGLAGLVSAAPLLVFIALKAGGQKPAFDYLLFALPATVCGVLAARIRDTGERD